MTDGVQKGAGNAYALQGAPNAMTLYPAYEDFIRAFSSGQLFTDLKLNPPGWAVLGTNLGKESLLSDGVAEIYGGSAASTPNDILYAIYQWLAALQAETGRRANVAMGSYTGDDPGGIAGQQGIRSLFFGFDPKVVFISGSPNSSFQETCIFVKPSTGAVSYWRASYYVQGYAEVDAISINVQWPVNGITWTWGYQNEVNPYQRIGSLNVLRENYSYAAIG